MTPTGLLVAESARQGADIRLRRNAASGQRSATGAFVILMVGRLGTLLGSSQDVQAADDARRRVAAPRANR